MILKMRVDFSAPVRVILTASGEADQANAVFSGRPLGELVLKNVTPEAAKELVQGEEYFLEFRPCGAVGSTVASAPEPPPAQGSGEAAPPTE